MTTVESCDVVEDRRQVVLRPRFGCVAEAQARGDRAAFHFPALVGGAPPAIGWQSLELLADKVLPYI